MARTKGKSPPHSHRALVLRVGVSSCLLGENVRWNGANKRDELLAGVLARCLELVPICPEVAIGLGVPRPPIRLEAFGAGIRAVSAVPEGTDVSAALTSYGHRMAAAQPGLNGYVFKSASPSCGLAKVKVHRAGGRPAATGVGLYARALLERRPDLPAIEEGALSDRSRRDAFLEQIVAHARWHEYVARQVNGALLSAFHGLHRLTLLTRGPKAIRRMEALLAQAGARPSDRKS